MRLLAIAVTDSSMGRAVANLHCSAWCVLLALEAAAGRVIGKPCLRETVSLEASSRFGCGGAVLLSVLSARNIMGPSAETVSREPS